MTAPHLNPSSLFNSWFQGSLAVDDRGRPLTLYHGTNQPIVTFDPEQLGVNTESLSSTMAFFFTENPLEAAEYADLAARKQVSNRLEKEALATQLLQAINAAYDAQDFDRAEQLTAELEQSEAEALCGHAQGANIMPVYLSVKDPLVVDLQGNPNGVVEIAQHVQYAQTHGYDGIKLINVYDPVLPRPDRYTTTQWTVFSPHQIVSAISVEQDLMARHTPPPLADFSRPTF